MRLNRILLSTVFVFIAAMAKAKAKAEAPSAPKASATCTACHGAKGVSANTLWPNLNGQKVDYVAKQLLDFKEGRRQDPLMSPVAKTLSAEDIKALSLYYSLL